MSSDNDISNTYGPLLLGGLIASISSGVLTVQCIVYSKSSVSDTFRTKAVVAGLWILDVVHSVLIWAGLWIWFISHFGDQEFADHLPVVIPLSILTTAFTTLVAHLVMLYRIYKLSHNNLWMTVPVLVLTLLRLVFACATSGKMIQLRTLSLFREELQWMFSVGLALSSVVDVLITGMMMRILTKSRSRSLSLDAVIDSLIIYTLENGAITSLAMVVSMICWLLMNNLIFLGIYFVIAKLYANSVLAVLNYRQHLRKTHGSTSRSNEGVVDLEVIRLTETHNNNQRALSLVPDSPNSQSRAPPGLTGRTPSISKTGDDDRAGVEVNVEKSVQFHIDYELSEDAESGDGVHHKISNV